MGAVSCNHSQMMISSKSSREAFMIACASVEVGVNRFSVRSSCGVGKGRGSVFCALVDVQGLMSRD